MKTVTYEEFLKFEPCWLEDEEKRKQKLWYARDRRSRDRSYDLWIRKHGDPIHDHHYGSASVYGEK